MVEDSTTAGHGGENTDPASGAQAEAKAKRPSQGTRLVLGVAVVWLVWCIASAGYFKHLDSAGTNCAGLTKASDEGAPPRAPARGKAAADLAGPPSTDPVNFDVTRDAKTLLVPLTLTGSTPLDLDEATVVVQGATKAGIEADLGVAYNLRWVGKNPVMDLCIDSRPLHQEEGGKLTRTEPSGWLTSTLRTRPGSYTVNVVVQHDGTATDPIAVTVNYQARYLWWVAPWVVFSTIAALFMVYEATAGALLDRAYALPAVTALGAAAVVFNAQGLQRPSWGGIEAVFALIASIFVAATGALKTVEKVPSQAEAKVKAKVKARR